MRALPQSGLRRRLPVRRHLQARGGRHRPDRSGQVPRLAHVRFGLPLQEDLLQLVVRQVREVHLLLSAHRGGAADRVFGDLRRPHPLSRRDSLRRRPHRGSRLGPGRRRSLRGAAQGLPRSARPRRAGAGSARRHSGGLAGRCAAVADLENGDGVEDRLPAASRIPHFADGLVRAAAVADPGRRGEGRPRHDRRHAGREVVAYPGRIPRQPAHRRPHRAGHGSRWNGCWRCAPTCAPRPWTA